jgi:N-dimethylarginine dimethylaminohydrolase
VDNLAIISSLRLPEHRREPAIVRRALKDIGLATTYLQQTYFEGAADALFDCIRPLCYAGYGSRTERSATQQLQEIVGCRVVPLMLVDERFPHLDMALCPLASGHVMIYMNAFSPHAQTMLRRTIDPTYLIEIDIDDALDLSCSAVEIGDALVLHRASRGLRERLNHIGYRIFCTELDEFIRAGGSAKSMALRFDQSSAPAMQAVLAR